MIDLEIGSNMSSMLSGKVPSTRPSEMAMAEKMTTQEKGLDQSIKNIEVGINLGKTAESSLSSVSDSLQRIKELALQASNGILTGDDRKSIQGEIQGLKEGINDALKNTNFNSMKLFDGGFEGNIQAGPNSNQGRKMQIQNTSLESLGIDKLDVTKDFDIEDIDKAMETVSSERSSIGAQNNALKRSADVNRVTRENTLSSRSNLDEDFESQIMDLKKDQVMNQYKVILQQKQQENDTQKNIGVLSILG